MTTGERAGRSRATRARRAVVLAVVLSGLVVAIGVVVVVTQEPLLVRLLGGLSAVVGAVCVVCFVRRLREAGSPRRFENDPLLQLSLGNTTVVATGWAVAPAR